MFKADISSKTEADKLIGNIQTHFGFAAECIVNCAGILSVSPLIEMSEKEFDEIIKVNLKVISKIKLFSKTVCGIFIF